MTSYPVLRNAPIVEAVIDIGVAQRKDFEMELLKQAYPSIIGNYPIQREQRFFESHFQHRVGTDAPKVETSDGGVAGYQYITKDQKQLMQFKREGFSFNRLKPYSDWKSVKLSASSGWKIYNNIAQPLTLTRLALRYINKLTFDLSTESVHDYMILPIALPPEFQQSTVDTFVYRTTINCRDNNLKAHYTLAREKTVQANEFSVIVDIDVFKELGEDVDDERVFEQLDTLRQLKNDLFFKTLTDKGIERYK